jgi:starch-binding outer membrane protein, SusD/RagB family
MNSIIKKLNFNSSRRYSMICGMALAAAFTSCEVNELTPYNSLSEVSAFSDPDRVELAVAGMYNAAQSGFYLGSFSANRGYPFGAAATQQGDMRGEDMENQALFYQLTYESVYSPVSANNVAMWQNLFALVNQTNIVNEGVQTALASGALKNEAAGKAYQGEARFLRALAYHELLIHFSRPYADNPTAPASGLPFRDYAINSPSTVERAKEQGRNTVAENYAKILEDLDFAEANLPDTRTGNLKYSRATKGAAIALKTRIKLHMQDWDGVIAEGNKLVPANYSAAAASPVGGYKLESSPDGPFKNALTPEHVFVMDNSATDNAGNNGALPGMYGTPSKSGRGLVLVSPIIYNQAFWLASDLRRSLLLLEHENGYYSNKYVDQLTKSDDTPIIRYAEVLLNLAEAEARKNGLTGMPRALSLLNAVRNRAVTSAANQFTLLSFLSPNTLIQAILNERRIEFLGEGRRWADIHRLAKDPNFSTGGIPAKVSYGSAPANKARYGIGKDPQATIAAIAYDDYRFLWPIPAEEVAQNATLEKQQNPVW